MQSISKFRGYQYWVGSQENGLPMYNVSQIGQPAPAGGYGDPQYLVSAKGNVIDASIFDPYIITKERVELASSKATVSRGKNKGMLLAKCPPVDSDAAAYWQAVTSFANPYKVGFAHLMFMSLERRILYNFISGVIRSDKIDVRAMDRDRKVLDLVLKVW